MIYVFDSCSFRVILNNYYESCFPSFWTAFNEMIESGSVISVREVYKELETQNFGNWIQSKKEIFKIPDSEDSRFMIRLFQNEHYRRNMIDPKKIIDYTQVADPFVIAKAYNIQGCVITQEKNKPNSAKIPTICENFNIRCNNLEGFLIENSLRF